MDKLNKGSKLAILAGVAVVAGVLVWQFGGSVPPAPPAGAPSGTSGTASTSTGINSRPGGSTTGGTGGGAAGPAKSPAAPTPNSILLVTPVPGDTWQIATNNPIQWSREAGVSGQIELLDAASKALVGVILNQTGVHQTSYSWNTRDILLSRTSPAKKTVVPGRYVLRLSFDAANIPSVTSQPFTLVQ